MVREIDKIIFDELVTGHCIVDFFTPDCPSCEKLSSVFEAVSEQKDSVNFFKVDLEEDITLAERFAIDHIPTLILFKDGKPVKTSVGFIDSDALIKFVESEDISQ